MQATIVDEAELGQLARLVARLTPGQQRLLVALADGFRGSWLEPFQWERAWQGSDLSDEGVLSDAEPGSLVVQERASTTASRASRRHLVRKV